MWGRQSCRRVGLLTGFVRARACSAHAARTTYARQRPVGRQCTGHPKLLARIGDSAIVLFHGGRLAYKYVKISYELQTSAFGA